MSILVLCHAYGIFTNIRNSRQAIYDFRLYKSFDHSWLFKSNIAMSKIFEYRPVNNRTMRYAAICVLSGNVAFGQNFIPHVDTCQSAMKSLVTIKASANRVLLLSKHQEAASLKCVIFSGMIRYLFCKLTIFIEFRYSLSVFPGETQVLPGFIVEICRGKTEKKTNKRNKTKQNKTKQNKTKRNETKRNETKRKKKQKAYSIKYLFDHSRTSFFIVTKLVKRVIQSVSL